MLGAIAGDIIGSVYEHRNIKSKEFPLFSPYCRYTDDSVLTVALADVILSDRSFDQVMRDYYREHPMAGFGGSFHKWASTPEAPAYNSWGNGSAMRTSPVGWAYDTLGEVAEQARLYASFTHNHPEGVKGAQAVSCAIYWARTGESKDSIREYVTDTFGYDLSKSIDDIRPNYQFDVSCQGSVPQAIISFLESTDYEDAIRNAISIGGDSDTIACIAGSISEAFYGELPEDIADVILMYLPHEMQELVEQFYQQYISNKTAS